MHAAGGPLSLLGRWYYPSTRQLRGVCATGVVPLFTQSNGLQALGQAAFILLSQVADLHLGPQSRVPFSLTLHASVCRPNPTRLRVSASPPHDPHTHDTQDVVTFLTWASYPEQDERKLMGVKGMLVFTALILLASYSKRFKWATLKSRRIVSDVVN